MKKALKWFDIVLNIAIAALNLYTMILILKNWKAERSEEEWAA